MARQPQLLDQWGNPVRQTELKQEIAAPTLSGVRSPATGYPGDGLNPVRLAQILREADAGDPHRYLELAQTIEERDPHYVGVLGTRRRSVSQLDITVEDASDDPTDVKIGEMVRDWIKRGELQTELFHILDAIGKGYSFTEIMWDTSMGQWWPQRLEYRDPRWFGWDRVGLAQPLIRREDGTEDPLTPFKFIYADFKAKSGIPSRAGLSRVVMWPYLFKKYTERDWSIFTQTYGQPLRLGRFGPGASEDDRATLMRAVANIAGDCAAIIPESMQIEFVQTGNLGGSLDLYERRADWYDKQVSKAVLGQTATTDAEVGGLGSGKEHRLVQEDIERADANDLGAILTRDLVIPFVQLNHGPRQKYPRLLIHRPEQDDLKAWTGTVLPWAQAGLEIAEDDVYEKLGLRRPAKDARILSFGPSKPAQGSDAAPPEDGSGPEGEFKPRLKGQVERSAGLAALSARGGSEGRSEGLSKSADRLAGEAAPAVGAMISQIEAMMQVATSLEELREMVLSAFPEVDATALAYAMGQAFVAAQLGGMAAVEDEGDG